MKKFNVFLTILTMVFAGVVFVGCEKNEVINEVNETKLALAEQNFKISNNMLVFADKKQYVEMLDKLNQMQPAEYNAWLKTNNFVSMEAKFSEFVEKQYPLAFINSEKQLKSEFYSLGKQYSDVAYLSKFEDGSEYYKINIFNEYYARIVNTKGEVQIGLNVYQITKDNIIVKNDKLIQNISTVDYYENSKNEKYLNIDVLQSKGGWVKSGNTTCQTNDFLFKTYKVEWEYKSVYTSSNNVHHFEAKAIGYLKKYAGLYTAFPYLKYKNIDLKYMLADGNVIYDSDGTSNCSWSKNFYGHNQVIIKGSMYIGEISDPNNTELTPFRAPYKDEDKYYPSNW